MQMLLQYMPTVFGVCIIKNDTHLTSINPSTVTVTFKKLFTVKCMIE